MKRSFFISLTIGLSLLLGGCTDKTEAAKEVAEQFLEAYFSTDYQKAATYCSEDLSAIINTLSDDFFSLDTNVQQAVVKVSEQLDITLKNVTEEARNVVLIGYEILSPESPVANTGYLRLNRIEKRWVITSLNR